MKFRTALLGACMLVVPATAMFSHRIPADWRSTVRAGVSSAVARWTAAGAGAASTDAVTVAANVVADPITVAPGPVAAGVTAMPLEPRSPPPAIGGAFRPLPPPAVTDGSDDARRQLAGLGAVGIECRPLHGMHVASCGVALDASGQLLRVFQASGPDPAAATRTLLADVSAWRSRLASGQPAAAAAAPSATGVRRF